jgi:glycosyltransferase involved in cell wall biosynthesis
MGLYEEFTEKFAIILPVYNEVDSIKATVEAIESLEIPYIVVDDGSTDGTKQLLYLNCIPNLTQYPNQGKGQAVYMGALYLISQGFEWIMVVDGDGQFSLEDIETFDNELLWHDKEYKLFVGNRLDTPTGMPKDRYATNRAMSWLISKLARQNVPDSQCGLKLIHKSIFQNCKLRAKRFDFDTEIVIKTGRSGGKIKSIPITCIYHKGRVSKMNPLRDGLRFLKILWTSLW